jgi:tetratricopeptide (TPR) repeat protein
VWAAWALCAPCLSAALILSPATAHATPAEAATARTSEALIEQALESYHEALESGERDHRLRGFRHAQRLFAAAIESGAENAELYTNLGNAALQAEELGQAVLAYRRALLLEPGLERARQNLQHARGLLPSWVPTPSEGGVLDTFFLWHQNVSRADRADLAAALFAIAALCLAASIYFRSQPFRYVVYLAAATWLALLLSLTFDPARDATSEGVVVAREALARAADSVNAPTRFGEPVPAGTEVKILEDRGGWLHVGLHNGRNAWVTASSVERVRSASSMSSADNARR